MQIHTFYNTTWEAMDGPVFSLSRRVICNISKENVQLILRYPLKAVLLHCVWSPAFELLCERPFVSLDEIYSTVKSYRRKDVVFFLEDLVRKGFLIQHGFCVLKEYPSVSIIIPVRDRPVEIEACLDSLMGLSYPNGKIEILVVDDASSDDTPYRASRFPVELIELKENRQAPFCRNLAGSRAKGDILAFVDSDCLVEPGWLMEIVPVFEREIVGAVGGQVCSYFYQSYIDRYEEVKSSLMVSTRAKSSLEGDSSFYVPSCNLLVRRKAFLEVGGFREDLIVGEDVDLCWRLQDKGYDVEFVPRGKVYHRHRNRFFSFSKRRFDYGGSEPLLQKLHSSRRKTLSFPMAVILFWGLVTFGVALGSIPLLTSCLLVAFWDAHKKGLRAQKKGIRIPFPILFLCTMRGNGAFLYYCSSFLSRYYLIGAAVLVWFWPWGSAAILGAHIFAGAVEYVVKKPRLTIFIFLFCFTLEQLSYQLGVWWGCIRNLSFSPLVPRLGLSRCFCPDQEGRF